VMLNGCLRVTHARLKNIVFAGMGLTRGPCAYVLPMPGLRTWFLPAWVSRGLDGRLGGLLSCYPVDGATVLLGCCGAPSDVGAWVIGV
jgi:hypothetical protein